MSPGRRRGSRNDTKAGSAERFEVRNGPEWDFFVSSEKGLLRQLPHTEQKRSDDGSGRSDWESDLSPDSRGTSDPPPTNSLDVSSIASTEATLARLTKTVERLEAAVARLAVLAASSESRRT